MSKSKRQSAVDRKAQYRKPLAGITTVGELRRALTLYPDELPLSNAPYYDDDENPWEGVVIAWMNFGQDNCGCHEFLSIEKVCDSCWLDEAEIAGCGVKLPAAEPQPKESEAKK